MRLFRREHWANIITGARLLFLPALIIAGVDKQHTLFVGLFAAQSLLDAVDGFVARRLHVESDFGRWLDTVIDLAIWLPSIVLFVYLTWDTLSEIFPSYPHLFVIPVLTSLLMFATAWHYLHGVAAIHLYTGKLTGGLVLLLVLTLLLDRFYPLLGYATAICAVVYHLEATAIYVSQKEHTDENVTSWLQVRRRRTQSTN
ncbi:MAG TPA: CDP-alcohol phosphatidyltransferase family protein [Aggregatilinea sp.]|uniref:CDP-alcohol phosphatidyltransferase family protein n=1 Tax=Aggregatilinea sp. TaxID=2806333 RepID=UPI002CA63576|nr:CDP-alcohol phosphatidyltransferase family protein [Aggregatilinea sp.]HML22292.1 CDP-alcohol phosphatidyltransferase family protein [Aggregatilinea sp.]